jgi:predicted peroxiredoxin
MTLSAAIPIRATRNPVPFLLLIPLLLVHGCAPEPLPLDDPEPALLVVLTAEDNMTQGMAMVLANQSLDQGAQVRVLLCGPGGELGLSDHDGDLLLPREVSPGQLLDRLIQNGVLVEVCAIFLPNTEWDEEDLREGVGVAQPADVASYMLRPGVRLFTF